MFDPRAGDPPRLEIREHLALEAPVQFATEEGQHILGPQAQRGVLEELFIRVLQGLGTLEHDIRGILGLVHDPVVLHPRQHILQQRIDPSGERRQHPGPVLVREAVRELLRPLTVGDPGERVVLFAIGDAMPVQLARQPLMAVQADLDDQRKPGLDADVQQSELAVQEIEVQRQALPLRIDQSRPVCSRDHLETLTRLDRPQHADQALRETVPLNHLADQVFFANGPIDVQKWPLRLGGDGLSLIFDPLRVLHDKSLEILDLHSLLEEQTFHRLRPPHGQMPLEQHPIKTRDDTGDAIVKLMQELFHSGVLGLMAV